MLSKFLTMTLFDQTWMLTLWAEYSAPKTHSYDLDVCNKDYPKYLGKDVHWKEGLVTDCSYGTAGVQGPS